MVENRGPQLAGVLGAFLGLVWLFIGLRLYVRGMIAKSFGVDDGFIMAAVILFTTYAACALSGVKYGTGRHIDDIPLASIPRALYFWWICEIFYNITTVLLRLSISVFLLRICIKKIHFYIIYANIFMIVTFAIFYLFLIIFQCSPYSYFWAQYAGEKGGCINTNIVPNATLAHSAVSFVSDVILSVLPVFLVKDLKMNMRTKISVAAILGLGILAGAATIIRIPYVRVLAITDDFLFATTDVAIWSTVEPGLGICAASAAALRPLFRSFYAATTRSDTHKTPILVERTSTWRNSRAGYVKSLEESVGSESLELKGALVRSETRMKISADVPLGRKASRRGREERDERNEGIGMGKIQIFQTVDIESETVSGDQVEHGPHTPWPAQDLHAV